jgi:L-ascorbate metabolism protein UlaG (beta-lactamase superfamily)
MTFDQLPGVDVVMVTHNHYDHLDADVIRSLSDEVAVVVPNGMGRWMRRRGRKRVIELGWWQQVEIGILTITLVPACHWSRRGVFDTNRVLWGGYVVEGGGCSIYHSGDSAWSEGFGEIATSASDALGDLSTDRRTAVRTHRPYPRVVAEELSPQSPPTECARRRRLTHAGELQ